ncbi:hypothetical protein GWK47_002795 [Chionoecetes opilio]|uniref:Uncharacterized protein n=1 Tax=Chionoecetes opilio TaxID=41210 RepID=A0A8J4XKT1_CHIOP|nr:hypothetical protein GWK47_002795 [Chionoecetes opilio]
MPWRIQRPVSAFQDRGGGDKPQHPSTHGFLHVLRVLPSPADLRIACIRGSFTRPPRGTTMTGPSCRGRHTRGPRQTQDRPPLLLPPFRHGNDVTLGRQHLKDLSQYLRGVP